MKQATQDPSRRYLRMKTLLHLLEAAPRCDRQIMAVTIASSALLLVLGATVELVAS